MWYLWVALGVISLPFLISLGLRTYRAWRIARAYVARGKVLDKLAAQWGVQRSAVPTARGRGLRMETDQELRTRIREEARLP